MQCDYQIKVQRKFLYFEPVKNSMGKMEKIKICKYKHVRVARIKMEKGREIMENHPFNVIH